MDVINSQSCLLLHYIVVFMSVCSFYDHLKVHKNENFFGFDFFDFCTVSLLVMLKYEGFVKKKIMIGPLEVGLLRVVLTK